MDAQSDKVRGRLKEAAGDLTGNKRLKRKGQVDQAGAKVREKVAQGVDKAKDVVTRER